MRLELTTLWVEVWCSSDWSIKNFDIIVYFTTPFICNKKFKSCLRDSLYYLSKKLFLNIKLEFILHNISCGVKKIIENVKTNISKVGRSIGLDIIFIFFLQSSCLTNIVSRLLDLQRQSSFRDTYIKYSTQNLNFQMFE